MKHTKLLFSILFCLLVIICLSITIINYAVKNTEVENKIISPNHKIAKFNVEEKPAKIIPYEQKTDSRRYIEHLYEYFDKIEKARDKPIRK